MNDIVFKRVFGDEKRKEILISFLNSVLAPPKDHEITDVTLLDPYQAPHLKDTKGSILDVRCRDESGCEYIVEMQIINQAFYDKRVLYYASKAYTQQLKKGENYHQLKPVVFIGILNFNFSEDTHYLSNHHVKNVKTDEQLIKDISFTFIELPKFKKKENELKTVEEKWIYFLKHASELKVVPSVIKERAIQEAFEITKEMNWTEKELNEVEKRNLFVQNLALVEEKQFNKGVAKGRAEGLAEGQAKGRAEAEAKAHEEKQSAAKELLSEGLSIDKIAQILGLPAENIELLAT